MRGLQRAGGLEVYTMWGVTSDWQGRGIGGGVTGRQGVVVSQSRLMVVH